MEFAKPLDTHENVVTSSGIKLLPMPQEDGDNTKEDASQVEQHVQNLLIESANRAATDLFLSSGTKLFQTLNNKKVKDSSSSAQEAGPDSDQMKLVDCKKYPTYLLPPSSKILPSSLVVIFESFDNLNFVYAQPGAVFHNRNGHFHHDDFINKPYGCKIRSRNNDRVGFCYLLRPTPELWQRSLIHRTQIVHELDSSLITFELNLRPNMVVCESGTGSGALSHCIMRSIAPYGKLHTYEFNSARVKAAREEFKKNGVDHLVEVHWRDVCAKPKSFEEKKNGDEEEGETIGVGGFAIGPAVADAIFLDLPDPWMAIPHAAHTIKPYGSICSYSPCVEQSQQTIQAMKKYGFHSIKTIEVRLREHYVDKVPIERAPTTKLPREPIIPYIPGAPTQATSETKEEENNKNGKKPSDDEKPTSKEDTDASGDTEKTSNKRSCPMEHTNESKRMKKSTPNEMLCARPFQTIKGHTAFLTFAHAGNKAYPDPNESK